MISAVYLATDKWVYLMIKIDITTNFKPGAQATGWCVPGFL